MRTFDHFPETTICPICKTNEDKRCCLVPIDGTEENNNVEAQPVHIHCLLGVGVIYELLEGQR